MVVLLYISLAIIIYTYIVYPVVLLIASNTRTMPITSHTKPTITVIIPAYNELAYIPQKIKNTQEATANYTTQIILVTSGSTDGSEQLQYNNVLHIHHPIRQGKAAAINSAILVTTGHITILTDCNTMLQPQAIAHLLQPLHSSNVGITTGNKQLQATSSIVHTERYYWQYESHIKTLETNYNTTIGAVGELMAIRSTLLQPIPTSIILDDFYLAMQAIAQGYQVHYVHHAVTIETPSTSLYDECIRRIRIACGATQWVHVQYMPNLCKYTYKVHWQLITHKLLRWYIVPPCILYSITYATIVYMPYSLIILASYGILAAITYASKVLRPVVLAPVYYIITQVCILIGITNYVTNSYNTIWKKAKR